MISWDISANFITCCKYKCLIAHKLVVLNYDHKISPTSRGHSKVKLHLLRLLNHDLLGQFRKVHHTLQILWNKLLDANKLCQNKKLPEIATILCGSNFIGCSCCLMISCDISAKFTCYKKHMLRCMTEIMQGRSVTKPHCS